MCKIIVYFIFLFDSVFNPCQKMIFRRRTDFTQAREFPFFAFQLFQQKRNKTCVIPPLRTYILFRIRYQPICENFRRSRDLPQVRRFLQYSVNLRGYSRAINSYGFGDMFALNVHRQ